MTDEQSKASRLSSANHAEDTRGLIDRISALAMLQFFCLCQTIIIPVLVLAVSVWLINVTAAFNFELVNNGSWFPVSAVTVGSALLSSTAFHFSGRKLRRQPSRSAIILAVTVLWTFGPVLACAGWLIQTRIPLTYITLSDLNISLWPSLAWAVFWTSFLLGARWIRDEYVIGNRKGWPQDGGTDASGQSA